MGFTKYGYNRGKGVFDEMQEEFKLAKENGIDINAVFLWLNAKRDTIGKLSPANQDLLNNLKIFSFSIQNLYLNILFLLFHRQLTLQAFFL